MQLCAMRFKGFTWPHNPEQLQMDYQREVKELIVPYRNSILQEIGVRRRVIQGNGSFYGNSAYSDFLRLAAVFRSGGSGTLVIPGFQPIRAYFSKLDLTEDPFPDFVQYSFMFLEESTTTDTPSASSKNSLTATQGDNLWKISARTGVSVETLLSLNSWLPDPFSVTAGQTIRLR